MNNRVATIQQLRKERVSLLEIGNLLGVSRSRIQQICKKNGISKGALEPKKSYFEKRKEFLLKNYTVDKETNCWNWNKFKGVGGYGVMSFLGRRAYVHRVAYSLLKDHTINVFQEGRNTDTTLHVCHTCDNPSCINPEHLWIGTQEDNMKDRDLKKKRNV